MSKKKKKKNKCCCCCCCCCNELEEKFVKGKSANFLMYEGDLSFRGSEAEKNGGECYRMLRMKPGHSLYLKGNWRIHIPWTEVEIYVAEADNE